MARPRQELKRLADEMSAAQKTMKEYFSEGLDANVDECYSRWATFLGQVDSAVSNLNEDRAKKAAARAKAGKTGA